MKFSPKKQLILFLLTISALLPSLSLAMDSALGIPEMGGTALEDRHIKTTQEKIDAAKAPIRHWWFTQWVHKRLATQGPEIAEKEIFKNHPFKQTLKEAQDTVGIPEKEQLRTIVEKFENDGIDDSGQTMIYANCSPKHSAVRRMILAYFISHV